MLPLRLTPLLDRHLVEQTLADGLLLRDGVLADQCPRPFVFVERPFGICLGRLDLGLAGWNFLGTRLVFESRQLRTGRRRSRLRERELGLQLPIVDPKERVPFRDGSSDALYRHIDFQHDPRKGGANRDVLRGGLKDTGRGDRTAKGCPCGRVRRREARQGPLLRVDMLGRQKQHRARRDGKQP